MKEVEMFTEEQSEKIAVLFEECLDILDPEGRTAFLQSACKDQPEIRAKVERLLKAHEACGKFLFGGTLPSPEQWGVKTGIEVNDLEPGGRVGPYRLLGLMGEGSTSTVFLAEQEDPVHRWVALKIVKPGMDSRKVLSRFDLERRALALMDHPGIAKLLDAGATPSGRPFFVMELVSGCGITRYCDDHCLPIPKRLELFSRICSAVLHAHQRGIIHRDIKPDNILVTDTGGVLSLKIIDFGIAKVLHNWSIENATRTGLIPFLGTPAYMSPEQVRLNAGDLDTRTDIYSLGALLYELLTGHPPFDHERLISAGLEEMFGIIKNEEPPSPSDRFARLPKEEQLEIAKGRGTTPGELIPTLKGDLDWITLKALEKNPDLRYSTAEGMAGDISRYFKDQPVTAAAAGKRYRLGKMLRRNRKLVTVIGTVGMLLLGTSIAISLMAVNARNSANQARKMEQAANRAEELSHQTMVSMHVSSGLTAATEEYNDKAFLWFANSARLAGNDRPAQAEVNARRALNWIEKVPLPVGAFKLNSNFRTLQFSRDSRFLLALDNDQNWSLWDAQLQDLLSWPAQYGKIIAAAWSPNGTQLALVLPSGRIQVHEPASGKMLHTLSENPLPKSIGFSPDGGHLIFGNSSLHVYDLNAGEFAIQALDPGHSIVGLAFADRSRRVVGVSDEGKAWVFEFQDGPEHAFLAEKEFFHQHAIRTDACSSRSDYQEDFLETAVLSLPAMTASGHRLLTRTGSFEITLWDLSQGAALNSVGNICCSCRFIIDSESALFASGIQGGEVGIWDIETARQRQILPSKGACILDVAFGNNGKNLVTAETTGRARIWDIEEGREIQSPLAHCTDVDRVAYSRDGRMVATGQSDGLVRIWSEFATEPAKHGTNEGEVPTVVRMNESGTRFILTREPSWEANCEACLSSLTIYSTDTGDPVGHPIQVDGCVETAAFSFDEALLATGLVPPGVQESGKLEIHNLTNPDLDPRIISLDSRPADLAWNPIKRNVTVICRDGKLICIDATRDPEIRWNTQIRPTESKMNPQVVYAHNGKTLVVLGPDSKIHVRDSETGKLLYDPLRSGGRGFWSISVSSDKNHLAACTISGEVLIWNLANGELTGKPLKHPKWVYRSRFSPDQKYLVTASHDGKVRLWDWTSGQLVAPPLDHPSEVYDAVFTPDSKWILTACRDGMVRLWEPFGDALMAPPVRVGHQAFNIEFNPSGNKAVIGNLCAQTYILSLEDLHVALPFDVDELCLLAEVVSSSHIENGTLHTLTTEEWIQRYAQLKRLHPEALHSPLPGIGKQGLPKSVRPAGAEADSPQQVVPLANSSIANQSTVTDLCENCTSGEESCPRFATARLGN